MRRVPRSQSPVTSACFFFFFDSQPPVSVLHNFVDGRGGGRGKDNRSRRNERLCPRCPWLAAVFCQQSVLAAVWKAKREFIQCVLISKNRFSDIKRYLLISENRFFDFLISKNIF